MYVDDVIRCDYAPQAYQGFKSLKDTLQEFNFDISEKKLVDPTTKANCVGIDIDTVRQTLSIPREKYNQILQICIDTLNFKTVTNRKFQSLIGYLMFIHKCIPSTRVFTNRLLQALRDAKNNVVKISDEVSRDIKWFIEFIPCFNGTATYVHNLPIDLHTIAIDASLNRVGGVWKNQVYSATIPQRVKISKSIVHFEMINILVALNVWKTDWKGKCIKLLVDNMAVVNVCNSGYSKDVFLAMCIRNIWLLTSVYDIKLIVSHIPGYCNVTADLLSRWEHTPSNFKKLESLVKKPDWMFVPSAYFVLNTEI